MPNDTIGESVFIAGGVPSITYVSRQHLDLEGKLRRAVRKRYSFVVVAGPTKSGKSVLCETVLAGRQIIKIEGGQIDCAKTFWEHVAFNLSLPVSAVRSRVRTTAWAKLAEIAASFPTIFQAKSNVTHTSTDQQTYTASYNNISVISSITALKSRRCVLLVDDFHFIDKETQRIIIRNLKQSVFDGLQVILLAVPHRAFDPQDVEAEVDGRVHLVRIPRWSEEDLIEIMHKGFSALNIRPPRSLQRQVCADAFGNPLFVQEVCYLLSEKEQQEDSQPVLDAASLARAYDRVIEEKGLDRFSSIFNDPPAPAARTPLRRDEPPKEGLKALILRAVARRGPKPETTYAEIREGLRELTASPHPRKAQVFTALRQMSSTLTPAGAPPMEWIESEGKLILTDPFLMFYIRWALGDQQNLRLRSAVDTALTVQPTPVNKQDSIGK